MSIYTIDSETELTSIADADELVIFDNDAGITKKVGADTFRQYSASGIVSVTASDAVTAAEHAGRTIVMNAAAGLTLTLPAASATGNRYIIVVGTTVTSNNYIIQAASASDEFVGVLLQTDTDTSDTLASYPALDGDGFDTVTLNGSTKGGLQGDVIEIVDIASGKFLIKGHVNGTGTVVTPFSAAV
jgi:hypothetical protein